MSDDADDSITLRGMRFHTLIGILPHEREHAQPIEIDLTAWTRGGGSIVDYRRLYADVRESVDVPAHSYLESLAESIATRVLADRGIQRVRIAVRKPHVALGGPLDYAEVAVTRSRHD